jgi:hypothetical protein
MSAKGDIIKVARQFINIYMPAGDVRFNIVRLPHRHPQVFNGALPADLCDVIGRLLHKQRHLRYARLQHFIDDLNRIVI